MRIDIATLFPSMCDGVLGESIVGRGIKNGYIEIYTHDIRPYTENKHNRVDDKPYGGGTGMVMQAQPIYDCIQDILKKHEKTPRILYMSPQGETLTQAKVKELAALDGIIILCGHYEGVDQRVLDELNVEEISVGDYVLTGGELPALILADAVARLQKGVLPNEDAYSIESHENGLLEYPQYTRPEVWRERQVPEVLLNGNHEVVSAWQHSAAITVTAKKRPDMLKEYLDKLLSDFWTGFIEEKQLSAETSYTKCFHFENTEQAANSMLKLVLRGKKRAGSRLVMEYERLSEPIPKRGDLKVVTDWDGTPRCVIETTKVRIIPFKDVTFDICCREGEDKTLEDWQSSHKTYFEQCCREYGIDFSEDMKIVFEDFRVVYKR